MVFTLRIASCFYRSVGRNVTGRTRCYTLQSESQKCFIFKHHGREISTSSVCCAERESSSATEILQNLDAEGQKELISLKLWYEYHRYKEPMLPATLTDQEWLNLLEKQGRKRTAKLQRMLRKLEIDDSVDSEEEKATDNKQSKMVEEMYLTLRKYSFLVYKMQQTLFAKLYGQTVVFDFALANTSVGLSREIFVTIRDISGALFEDAQYIPVNVVLCNLERTDYLNNFINTDYAIYGIEDKLTITSKSYLDLYPKQDLVYLLPGGRKSLLPTITTYNTKQVYVIGVSQRESKQQQFIAKAKEEGITLARLPYHLHESGRLTIDPQFVTPPKLLRILVALHNTGSWKTAMNTLESLNPDDERWNDSGIIAHRKKMRTSKAKSKFYRKRTFPEKRNFFMEIFHDNRSS